MSKQVQIKLVLLGEAAVGKSSIVLRFVKGEFSDSKEPTIGAAFLTQKCRIPEDPNKVIKFEIWDTAGQERFNSLAPMYYRNAHAAIVVFDCTQPKTFEKAKLWINELKQQANPNIIIALASNKSDLPSQIDPLQPQKYAQDQNLLYFETSAKTGLNLLEMFTEIARNVPQQFIQSRPMTSGSVQNSPILRQPSIHSNQEDSSKCC